MHNRRYWNSCEFDIKIWMNVFEYFCINFWKNRDCASKVMPISKTFVGYADEKLDLFGIGMTF